MLRCTLAMGLLALVGVPTLLIARDDPPSQKDPATLVKELGSPSFQARESAERKLKTMGVSSLPAVKAGAAGSDVEIADRCRRLIRAIRESYAQNFVDGKQDHDSPAWTSFKAVVGDSEASRQLFVDMMAGEQRAEAIERAEANPAKAHEVYASTVKQVNQTVSATFQQFVGQPASSSVDLKMALRKAVPAADVATVLFLGRVPLRGLIADPGVNSSLFRTPFDAGMDEPTEKQFRKLFEAWLIQRDNVEALDAGVKAILFFGLKEGTPTARRILLQKTLPPRLTADALVAIGHHGTKSDLPLVAAFRDDNRASGSAVGPAGKQIGTYEVRDVAAAMALKLSGEDFTKYGFRADTLGSPLISADPPPFRTVSMFESAELRAAALKKAWEWLDRQPKAEAPPPSP